MALAMSRSVLCDYAANGNGMPPPPARIKADDDDIFGDAGTDYVCELPKVGHNPSVQCYSTSALFHMLAMHVT